MSALPAPLRRGARYAAMFERCATRNGGALVPFWMLGDPSPERSLIIIEDLIARGADALELGLPFSDPVADGPVVQAAALRARAAGVGANAAFELIAELRRRHPELPIGLLAYLNPLVAIGPQRFAARCADAGVDSLLVADLPVAEMAPYAGVLHDAGVAPVLVMPPNAPPATLDSIARWGAGYVYATGRPGVTGNHAGMQAPRRALIEGLRSRGAPPVLVGFGVSEPAQVRAAREVGAAGVIVGSALVALGGDDRARAARFAALRAAC